MARHPPPVPQVVVKSPAGASVAPPGTALGRGEESHTAVEALSGTADGEQGTATTAADAPADAPRPGSSDGPPQQDEPTSSSPKQGSQHAKPSFRTCCAAFVAAARARATLQAVAGITFSMGLAWKGATLAVVNPDRYLQDPRDVDNLAALWVLTALFCMFLVAVIAALLQYEAGIARRAETAGLEGDHDTAFALRIRERSVHAIIHWGLTFAVATQIDSAVAASMPKSPSIWRILYLVALLVIVASVVVIVRSLVADAREAEMQEGKPPEVTSPSRASRGSRGSTFIRLDIAEQAADAILSGSAYVVALALLSVTDAVFKLQQASSSVDLDYLALYMLAVLATVATVLQLLAFMDSKDATKTAEAREVMVPKTTQVYRAVRKLIGKSFAMSAVVVVYAFLYVAMASALGHDDDSLYDPLPVGGAFIFCMVAILVSVLGGVAVRWSSKSLIQRLSDVDTTVIPGDIDDVAVSAIQQLAATSSTAILEAFSWLVGCSIYSFMVAIWEEIISNESPTDVEAICSGLGLAFILTMLSVTVVACVPMPQTS